MKKLLTFLTLLTLFFATGWAETKTDILNYSFTGIPGTGYSEWSGKQGSSSSAVYAGYTAGANNSIQLRSNDNQSGIISTTSGGKITKVLVSWNNATGDGRTLQIYGKNSAYTSTEELYNTSTQGTLLGTIVYGSSVSLNISGDYAYIGLRSASGAMYLTKIEITWEEGGSTVETVATPTFSPAEGTFTSAQNVTIACATSGATIHYTTDGTTPTTSSSVYSSAISVSETTTIKAIAVKSGMNNSDVATATYTINTPGSEMLFERVTSISTSDVGKKFLLVYETTPAVMGSINSSNYGNSVTGSTNFTLNNGVITLTSVTTAKPVTLGGTTDAWTFDLDGSKLAWTSGNTLTTGDEGNTWTISFGTDGNAVIANKGTAARILQYNSSSPRFACYTSTQGKIYLYKEVENVVQVDDLYLIGYGMNGTEGWNLTTAPQMTYSNNAGTYAVDVYFDKAQRGMFQFAKGLSSSNDNWNGLTGRLYPSTSGSNVNVDTYNMDGTVGLYFTDNSNMYSFELPAGLYTITANLSEWKTYVTQKPVTMTISPNSATFDDTKSVTLASNLTDLGGKIYYTTDGTEPSATNGTEYTGTITLDATTTIKAIAILGYIQSEVVEKTYTKKPTAPVITPNGGTIYAATQVTITAQEGATIYYTTDGSTPSNSSTQYTEPLTVSATTTVKAIAYVGDTYSNVTTAEFTYSNVQPSTGDFVLVTSASQLVAGNEYIIMTTDPDGYKLAMGDIVSSKGSWTQQFGINGNVGAAGSTVSVYSESTSTTQSLVNILELENTNGQLSLKQQSAGTYLNITSSSSTNISASSSKTYLTIEIDEDNYWATIQGTSSRQILFSGQNDVFGNYSTSNANASNFSKVYLYTRESNSVQPPVFTPVGGVYDVPVDVTISCATTGASIYYTTDGSEPSATNGTLYNGEEFLVSETTTYKAVAVKNGNTSSVVTAEYTIAPHTAIETVTLDYSEPFTAGIGKFVVENVSGYSPVWTLDGNYGIKGTAYNANTNPTNNAAVSRFLSPIIDMTDATQPELTFSHQINSYFTNVANQCQLFIRETTNGTSGTWVQLPITFSDPVAAGGWTNDVVDIDLSAYAGKKVQISFLYTNPTEGSGAGTWEIQNFRVADNSEYKMVNNIAEFLALENGTKAKFKNPVTVLYDYAQYSSNSYHEYIWVKDESGFMQFYLIPTLNSSTESSLDAKAAYYENGDIIPGGFVVVKNYYENGKFVQAYSAEALDAGFQAATQKGLADPDYIDFDVLSDLDNTNTDHVATWCNRYITLEKIKLTSSSKNFNFQDENGTTNSCVGYNKYNGDGSLLKDGTTSADVIMPTDLTKYYNVKAILQLWQGGWEIMPIEFTEWKPEEVTLRKLCADGVEQNTYTISNNLLGVYASADGTKLWVKDDNGQSICPATPDATYKDNFPIEAEDNTRLNQALYDQSNWCEIHLNGFNASSFEGKIIKGGSIQGTFTDKTNPTLTGVSLTSDDIYSAGSYAPNYYIPANFYGNQPCWTSHHGEEGHGDFYFMTPKPQEFAMVVWSIWDSENEQMIITDDPNKNSHELKGSFSINLELNNGITELGDLHDGTNDGFAYNFSAIIRKAVSGSKAGNSDNYMVYPVDLNAPTDPATAINTVDVTGKAVKSVKYVNVAGIVSDHPFQGVNIVVTEYTDGTRTTTKMLRK